jgi:hypothetical protein
MPGRWTDISSRDHLQGKIAYVRTLHPARAEKLQALFEAIDWK